MREYNKTPVSVIAKLHNSPAAQLWVRISIAIKAERRASGTNSITHRIVGREIKHPPTFVSRSCFLRPFMFNIRFRMPHRLFSYWSSSLSGHLLHLLAYWSKVYVCVCSCYLAFLKTCIAFSSALVYVAVPTVRHLSYSLCAHRCRAHLLCWMGLLFIHLRGYLRRCFCLSPPKSVQINEREDMVIQRIYFGSK